MLITKTSSDQFEVYALAKTFLCFEILTWSPALNLGYYSLESTLYSAQELDLTSIGFILIFLWDVLLYLSTISSKTSKQTFFETDVICHKSCVSKF